MVVIIKHPDTYRCSICGTEYYLKSIAELCETYNPIKPCKYKIGDKVLVESRYDGLIEVTINKIEITDRLGRGYSNRVNETVTLHRVNKPIPIVDYIKSHYLKPDETPHRWLLTSEEYVEVSKDGDTSSRWLEEEVISTNDLRWNNSYEELKLSTCQLLVKYIYRNEEYIDTSSKDLVLGWADGQTLIAWSYFNEDK